MKRLNIAIIGLGNIGSYLFKFLSENKRILTEKNNCLPVVKYVSAKNKKRKRNIKIKKNQWINNYLSVTKFKDVDLIIELIGGLIVFAFVTWRLIDQLIEIERK